MTRRSLLFYTHALVGGGAERVMARLASGFAARGDRVMLAVDFEAQESRPYLSNDVTLHVLPRGHWRATRGLARLIATEKPDASLSAISVSNLKHAIAAAMAGRRGQAILSYHGFFESEPQRLSRLGYYLTPLLARATAATVAVSDSLRDDLVARFHVSRQRIVTIHNPGAPDAFPSRVDAAALVARPLRIVALGRLVADKDFSTLLRAFALLPQKDAELTILGEGPERANLEAEARALGIAKRVTLPGFTRAVGAALDRARVLAVSSRRESFSLACIEALAHGLPVVATDCGGPAEIINTRGLGWITPVGDAAALAEAMGQALAAPGDPAPRQARARQFTLDVALDRYDALIDSVIRHGRVRF